MSDSLSNIVIDNGSSSIKCGFSGEEAPKSIFSNVISQSTDKVGDDSLEDNISPIEHGIIVNFDLMEKIWEHTFLRELKVSQDERNILTSDSPLSPKMNREKMTQIMFEKFNVQGLFICIRPMLSMYCVGKTSALVVESGDDVTQVVPINEGYYFPYSITKSNLGGKTVTNFLMDKLSKKITYKSKNELKKLSKIIKEKLCRVSLNYEEELKDPKFNEIQYKLPDENELKLEKELFICPETLFDPNLTGQEIPGIPMQMYNSIMKCENEIRKELYSNIILAGGNTLLNDFHERIHQEIQCLAPNSVLPKLKVFAQNERKYTAWIGGALIAGLQNFQANWVTHAEYQDAGPQIIHRKCF